MATTKATTKKAVTKKDTRPRLAIKYNNTEASDSCAICGKLAFPTAGPELFMEGTWEVVCYECGDKYAPELMNVLHRPRPGRHTSRPKTKGELLEHYADHKTPTHFVQFDRFVGPGFKANDGDTLFGGDTYELMNDWPRVRVLVTDTCRVEDVLTALNDIAGWIKRYPDLVTDYQAAPVGTEDTEDKIPF